MANNSMKLKALRPILWTCKFDETIDFYTNVLAFDVRERNDEWRWASLYKDEVEIMLARPNEGTSFDKPIFTGSFYFITDNVDMLWDELKCKTKVCYEIANFDWEMREFGIYDNNGYILQFGQDTGEISNS